MKREKIRLESLCWYHHIPPFPGTCRRQGPPQNQKYRSSWVGYFSSIVLTTSILLLLLPDPGESLPPSPPPPPPWLHLLLPPPPAWTHMQGSINRGPGLAVWQAGYCSRPGAREIETQHCTWYYTTTTLQYTVYTYTTQYKLQQQHSNRCWSWSNILLKYLYILVPFSLCIQCMSLQSVLIGYFV